MISPKLNPQRSPTAEIKTGSIGAGRAVCRALFAGIMLVALAFSPGWSMAESVEPPCRPTPPDSLGPFYKSGAPMRETVGSGYRLTGIVRSASGCHPIPQARIELWMAGPDGDYDDAFRATVMSQKDGTYHFESHYPPKYFGRPPHIHIRVSVDGFQTLITQHYPAAGAQQGNFDLVLLPR